MNMICYPNAKINLGLKVLSRRTDGFHNISSFFAPIPLCDILEVQIDNSLKKNRITYSGLSFVDTKNDLIIKVYNLLKQDFKLPFVRVHLHKNIPLGSGLGGGSSNAVSMLLLLNKLFDLKLTKLQLIQYAQQIGSDCTFFLFNQFSHVLGRGEQIQPIDYRLNGYHIVIIKPHLHCSSAKIFTHHKLKKNTQHLDFFDYNWEKGIPNIKNDLEPTTLSLYPELKDIKKYLLSLAPEFVSMTGSGSAFYALFKHKIQLENPFDAWLWQSNIK